MFSEERAFFFLSFIQVFILKKDVDFGVQVALASSSSMHIFNCLFLLDRMINDAYNI